VHEKASGGGTIGGVGNCGNSKPFAVVNGRLPPMQLKIIGNSGAMEDDILRGDKVV